MSQDQFQSSGHFSDAYVIENLKSLVLRGGAVKLLSQAVKLLLRVGGLMIMARLLTPQDFGVFAMLSTFTMFLLMVNANNLIMPTVQKDRITQHQVSNLFWVSAGLGAFLSVVTAVAGRPLAWFYREPRLVAVALGISPVFFIRGLAIQHEALLQRRMRLVAIELGEVVSQSLGAVAMIISALRGAGYWSLVLNMLVMTSANSIFFWILADWRPSLPRRGTGVREMLLFSGNLSSYVVWGCVQRTIDRLMIGRVWGAEVVGFYEKAIGLFTLFFSQLVNPISFVVVPALSRLQSQPERYRRYYAKSVGATLFLTMSFSAFICVDATQIVLTALGRKWLQVVPIFLALAPAMIANTLTVMYTWICLSLGRGKKLSRAAFLMALGASIAFLIGLPGGAIGVARAYSIAYCVLILPVLFYALSGSPISLKDIRGIVWRPALAAGGAALLTTRIKPLLHKWDMALIQLVVDFFLFAAVLVGIYLMFPGGLEFLRELRVSVVKAIHLGRRPSSLESSV